MFTAAPQLIALNWKAVAAPTLDDWLHKIWHTFLLNKLTVINRYHAIKYTIKTDMIQLLHGYW